MSAAMGTRPAAASPRVRPADAADRPWIAAVIAGAWASTRIVTRGCVYDALELPALIAEIDAEARAGTGAGTTAETGFERAGLLTYRIDGDACEILSLNSTREGHGAATALLARITELARAAGCRRVWLITSNDNLPALGFYQRRGYELVAVHRHGIDQARRLKPEIPLIGLFGIPLRDEIERELRL
jgi:ribosomal protein S18 acetylase RimI-like enzyme